MNDPLAARSQMAMSLALGERHRDLVRRRQGLDAVPVIDRPPVLIVHLAFQIMVGCGMLLVALGVWIIARQWRRRRGLGSPLPDDRVFLTFVGFTLLYIGLATTVVFLLWRQILKSGVGGGTSLGMTGAMPIPTLPHTQSTVGVR